MSPTVWYSAKPLLLVSFNSEQIPAKLMSLFFIHFQFFGCIRHFQIIDGKLMPSLSSIEGMGEKAADAVMEAAKDGPFLSKDDFRDRTKVTQTTIDTMSRLGLFGDLPESNQISLFDFMVEI